MTDKDIIRFWNKVKKTSTCWLYQGGRLNKFGYGSFWYNGATHSAHRTTWKIAYGCIPNKYNILHKCDIPNCVNPEHLFVGTLADNNKDRANKNRSSRGVTRPTSKLRPSQVFEIRKLYSDRLLSIRQLAANYGVTYNTIWQLLNNKTWQHENIS